MNNNYSLQSCESLINKYVNEYGGEVATIEDGCLGLGTLLLHGAKGKKTILIKEFFINSWNSGHTIKMFNKMPKKYETILSTLN